jgi:hypothetical protein
VIDVGSIPRLVINVSPMSDVARSCTSRSVAHFDTPSADTANRLFVCGRLHGSSFRSNYVPTKRRWRLAGTRVSRGLSSQAPGFARTLCPDPRAMFSAWSLSQRNLPETTGRLTTKPNALPPWVGRSALFSRDGIDKSHPAPSHSRPIAVAGDGHLIAQRYGVVLSCVILN